MKKLTYILASLLLLTACAHESVKTVINESILENGMLSVEFTVLGLPLRPNTKAFGMTPDIRSMKVVVFDQYGVYISQSDAELIDVTTSDNITTGKYQANFPVSDKENEKRIIHFLVNYDQDIEFGTELEVISKLIVDNGTDCYWQRIEVTDLTAVEQSGNLVLKHQNQLRNIVLIRNFCAFTVSTDPSTSNLDILSAAIYNVPDKGTLAPYSSDNSSFVGGNGFVTNYQNYRDPETLIGAGYKAAVPLEYQLTDHASHSVLTDKDGETITLFSYEREKPLSEPPFILVSGKWGTTAGARESAPTTYYKINLRDINDEYFPLLRNFNYKINIKEVKRAGATTIEDALASIGSGEISTDLRYIGLTDISNGEARMMVTTVDVVLVSDAPYKELMYKFFPDVASGTESNNDVTISLGPAGESGSVFSDESKIVVGADNSDGWREITFYPNEPGETVRKQSVILTGTYQIDDKSFTITRTVNFTLRQRPALTAQCVSESTGLPTTVVAATKETPFTLKIGMPNGLPSSIFPVDLLIEARESTISPNTGKLNNIMPISSGKTMFGTDKPAFCFTKSVQYSEYQAATANDDGYKYFNAYFKTNIAASSTDIIVENHYFVPAVTYFTNGEAKRFRFYPVNVEQTSASAALLSFYMQTTDPITLNLGSVTPSGKNFTRLAATGTPGVYTYTPTDAGMQEIGLALDEDLGCFVQLSATDYDNLNYRRLSSHAFSFTGSDRTDNSMAVIPGFTTRLTLPVSAVAFQTNTGTLKFSINGTQYTATKSGENYILDYTVSSTQAPGPLKITATATENGLTTTSDLGTITVWKQKITVAAREDANRITNAAGLSNNNVNWDYVGGGTKKIWKGIVLRNNGATTRFMTWNGSFANNQPGNNLVEKHFFQSNGTTYLRTYGGGYLSTANINVSYTPTTVTITYNGDGWVFTNGTIANKTNMNTLQSNANTTVRWNSVQGRNIDDNYRWNAYPVTVEYVAP